MTSAAVAFGLYLAITLGIGLWAARRARGSQEDYFLAGRSLSPLSMALSAVSSGRSAWLVVGASGLAWSQGLSALWVFPGYVVAEALLFVTVGPRLRARSIEAGAITIPEVLERLALGPDGKPGTSRLPLRAVAALVICAFLLTYVSAQLGAGAKTLGGVFEVAAGTLGLGITAAIVLVYTLLGGYRAVVVTDVVQALFMLAGMVLLPLLGLAAVGGGAALLERLRAIDPALLELAPAGLAVVGGLAIGLGSPGNPHILVRHMSLGDPRHARIAMWTGTLWNAVMAGGALLMGLVGRALHPTTESLTGGGREYLFANLTRDLTETYLVAAFAGILLATLFAAVMSTCDSQLLVVASSFVRDLRRRGEGEEREGLGRSRAAVLVTLVLAVGINLGELPLVNDLVLLSWSALGAAFGPAVLLVLYDRRTTARGVLAGIVVGAGAVALLNELWAVPRGKHVDYELIVACLLAGGATLALRDRR